MVLCRFILATVAFAALGASVGAAHATSRLSRTPSARTTTLACKGPCDFPDTRDVLLRPGSSDLVVMANFGLLYPDGRVVAAGAWNFVCEENFGGKLAENFQFHPDGRIFAPSLAGLFYSADGCTWSRGGGALDQTVWDMAIDPTDPNRVWALAGDVRALFLSTDGGRTFARKHDFLDGHRFLRVIIAASDPKVMYLSGYRTRVPLILAVSKDGGATWTVNDAASTGIAGPGQTVNVVGVAPDDPSTLYASVLNQDGDEIWRLGGNGTMPTKVLALAGGAEIRNFTFGATARDMYIAARDPLETVGKPPAALHFSHDGGATWTVRPVGEGGPRFRCLRYREGKLYACGGDMISGDQFMVGVSSDEGMTWEPLVKLSDIKGVTACVAAPCATTAAWMCDRYSVCANVVRPDGGAPPPPVDAGTPKPRNGGCSFGGAGAPGLVAIFVAGAVAAMRRRRREGKV